MLILMFIATGKVWVS